MEHLYDVVVIGAGPSGSSAAYYLAVNGLDVLLLDKATFPRDKTCGDGLTPRALDVLTDMGVINEIDKIGYRVNEIDIYAPHGHVVTSNVPKCDGMPDYLMTAPRLYLDDIIRRRALSSGVKYRDGIHVKGIMRNDGTLIISGGYKRRDVKFMARTIVIATGANSKLLMSVGTINRVPSMILAARVYYENVRNLRRRVQAHMDGITMPGYGWVFPISDTTANVGLGFWPNDGIARKDTRSARAALFNFVSGESLRDYLDGAHRLGPIKGYPLRTDFGRTPTFKDRILLVGEAAGLVNPLTGEGIDLALESGKLVAEHLVEMFKMDDLSYRSIKSYDLKLREKYLRTFHLLRFLRMLYVNPFLTNRLIRVANNSKELRKLLVDILLGYQNAVKGLYPHILLRVLIGT